MLELFIILIHLLGGLPTRATDLVSTKIRDNLSIRNLMVDEGTIISTYDPMKNAWRSSISNPVFRFLPHRLGRLVFKYLSTVLPFLQWAHF